MNVFVAYWRFFFSSLSNDFQFIFLCLHCCWEIFLMVVEESAKKKPPFSHRTRSSSHMIILFLPFLRALLAFSNPGRLFCGIFPKRLFCFSFIDCCSFCFSQNQKISFFSLFIRFPPGIQAIFHCCGCGLFCMLCKYCKGVFETWAFS